MIKVLEMESSKGWGGQEKRTVRLVNNLPKNEFEVFWAVEKNSILYEKKDEIKATLLTYKLNRIYNLVTIFKLIRLVNSKKIDIISTHSGKDSWIGDIVGLFTKAKVVRVRHLILPIKSPYSYNLADKVVTVSNQVKEYLNSAGVKKEKLLNIYTGIDTNRFNPEIQYDLRKELNLSNDTVLIGIVAVLRGAKQHIKLIETFSKINHDNVKLLIIGEGPMKEEIETCISNNNLKDKVLMLGHREDVHLLLPNLDMFCLPSRHEALGTSLLEAQSCGVPVLGSNVGGIPEALCHGQTGYLFDDFDDLEKKISELLENKEKLQEFKNNSRKFILEKFSVEKMMEDTKKLYRELCL